MKNVKKKIIIIIILCILVIVWLMLIYANNNKIIRHLNRKYDDKFEYYEPFGGELGAKSEQMIVKSKKYPDYEIWAEYFKSGDVDVFRDNYVDCVYREKMEKYLENKMIECFESPVIIVYDIGSQGTGNNWEKLVSFEEYLTGKYYFQAVVYAKNSNMTREMIEKNMENAFINEKINISGRIYFAEKEEQFKSTIKLLLIEK